MSKEISFYITDFRGFYELVNKPIRTKEDIIEILLLSVKSLLLKDKLNDEGKGTVNIIINNSSRIYFICKNINELPNKYYSFTFPFIIEENKDKYNIRCRTSSEIINSELIDKLLELLNRGWFSDENENTDSIDKFACDYIDVFEDYYSSKGIDRETQENFDIEYWSIIKNLFTFEPGYIRYDYDPIYEDGDKHPLNHLDIHYSSNSTFKLGFNRSIQIQDRLNFDIFKDILENGKLRDGACYKIL